MRLATFNIENLFRRPVVLDQPTWAEGREQLNDYTKVNGITGKASYSSADKKGLVDFWIAMRWPTAASAASDHAAVWADLQ